MARPIRPTCNPARGARSALVAAPVMACALAGPAWAQATDDAVLRGEVDENVLGIETVVPEVTGAVGPVGPTQRGVGGADPDPYGPLGLRIGTFDVTTTLDLGVTALRTKSTEEDAGAPGTFIETIDEGIIGEAALSLAATSDWSRHELELTADGRLPFARSGDADAEPLLDLGAALRLDLGTDTTLTARGGYGFDREDPSSAAVLAATDPVMFPDVGIGDAVDVHRFDGALTLARQIGPVAGEVEINAEREIHAAARLTDGTVIAQDDLDFTRVGARMRGGLDTGAVVTPFIEAEISQRIMDEPVDSGGIDRNALRYAARAGLAFDRGEKLNGEIAAGYVYEDLADPGLTDIAGVSVAGALNWSPARGTDVRLGLSTSTTTSGSDDVSGSVVYAATAGVTHRARANLQFDGQANLTYDDVTGNAEDTLTASGFAGATWWLNRIVGLTGRIGYERTFSDDPGERGETVSGFAGIRMQR